MSLPDALHMLDEAREHMACVIDEHGGFVGVLTQEDLVEEIVGDVRDEHDPEAPTPPRPSSDGSWELEGDMPLDEAERLLQVTLPRGENETLAGLVIDAHGALPDIGEHVVIELPPEASDLVQSDEPPVRHLDIEVLDVARYVPTRIRVRTNGDRP